MRDDILVISVRTTRKVGHILANPKGSMVISGEPGDGGGYLLKGMFLVEDPDDRWIKKLIYRYETVEKAKQDIIDWTTAGYYCVAPEGQERKPSLMEGK